MKYLLLALFCTNLYANDFNVGYLYGTHVNQPELNNSHPFIEVPNVIVFENSYKRLSIAGFYKAELGMFKLRMGATSGYPNKETYNGYTYTNQSIAGIMPFLVPSIEIEDKHLTYIVGIMGNSINAGLAIGF